jgi:hypothetical protein
MISESSRISLSVELAYPVSFCLMIPPSLPFCLPDFPPSTTNRSSWKNWLTTVCLCIPHKISILSSHFESISAATKHNRRCTLVWRWLADARPKDYRRTLKTCSSFNPFCISSCIRLASVSVLCSRKASFVLRLAYSRKLYAANWFACRNKERYKERTSTEAGPDIPVFAHQMTGLVDRQIYRMRRGSRKAILEYYLRWVAYWHVKEIEGLCHPRVACMP